MPTSESIRLPEITRLIVTIPPLDVEDEVRMRIKAAIDVRFPRADVTVHAGAWRNVQVGTTDALSSTQFLAIAETVWALVDLARK